MFTADTRDRMEQQGRSWFLCPAVSLRCLTASVSILAFSHPAWAEDRQSKTSQPTAQPTVELVSGIERWAKTSPFPPIGDPDLYLPANTDLKLIVILSKRRVYVHRGDRVLASYPIAVGKSGWETPTGTFAVFEKELNPIFKSFKSGTVIPPGSDNPLGVRWIGIWSDGKTRLGFHGTNQAELIGQAVSHGCIRMYNKDVVSLFETVEVGTPVLIKP